ncbi:hypothetical protein B0H11DRAFT_1936409 [Mycena galericulata]|nr:hypothetical protein B0H11DRAFT_1936409 [Mycena galericulata]
MTNQPYPAPSAYPQYAAGAPAPPTQSSSPSADQGQAWQLLSQAATAMAHASGAAPAPAPTVQAPATGAAPAPATGGGIRMTGPWVAGRLYSVVPTGPLTAVPDNAEKWFAITKGRYIGVTNSAAIADGAVSRVSNSLRAGYGSQSEALQAFNDTLASPFNLVAVVN